MSSAQRPSILAAWNQPNARLFASLMLLVGLGIEGSKVVRDTFFLQAAGAQQIPWVYIVFALVMIICSLVYSRASRRFSLRRLSCVALGSAALLAGCEWVLLLAGFRSVSLAYVVFCSVEMFFIFLPMTLWAYASEMFSVEEGEVLIPSISTYCLIGTVVGGLIARVLSPLVGPYNTLFLSALSFAMALVFCRKLQENVICNYQTQSAESSQPKSPVAWSESLVKTLIFLAFPLWILVYLIEYTYYFTLGQVFTSAIDLSSFLALFVTVCSLSALLIQLHVTPLLVERLGVGATYSLYPCALAVAAVSILVFAIFPENSIQEGQISLPVVFVLVARFLDMALYQSVYDSTVHVLYYAVPQITRTQARALVSGIIFPAAIACAGLTLVCFSYFEEPIYNVAFTAVCIGFLVVIMAMDIRPDYLRALLTHVDPNDRKLRAALMEEISHLSLNESRHILLRSLITQHKEESIFAVDKLFEQYDRALLSDLIEIRHQMATDVKAYVRQKLPPEELLTFDGKADLF